MLINTALKEAFEDKVAKLNKRAVKLGQPSILIGWRETAEYECSSTTIGRYKRADGKFMALYTEVEIIGDAPRLAGWDFLATVDLTGSKPMVRRQPWTAPGVDLSAYFHSTGFCQHCNQKRVRNSTLIVRNVESGELMEIGRNCAADFFRSTNAEAIVGVWDKFSEFSDEELDWSGNRHYQPIASLERLFETAVAVVRKWGYVKKQESFADSMLTSTRSRVFANLFPHQNMAREDIVTVTEADKAEAAQIIEWVNREWLQIAARTEFQLSVQAAVETGENGWQFVRSKNINYLVWMVSGFKTAMEKKAATAAAKVVAGASNYVGSLGERIEEKVTLKFRRLIGTAYGTSALCKMVDAAGNCYVTFSSGGAAFGMKLNQEYLIKGTIKAHKEYEGVKQTELNRVMVLAGELEEVDG
jgi:hypothetical protein